MLTQAFQDFNFITATAGQPVSSGNKNLNSAEGMGKNFKSIMDTLISKMDTDSMDMDTLMSLMNIREAIGKKSSDLMALLAGKIKDNGTIPSKRFVGEDGLAALESLLNGMGFNQEKVGNFIRSVKQSQDKGEVSLSTLFTKLGQFIKENDSKDELELSAIPYIESLLNSFGIEPRQVDKLMKNAGKSGSGLDLDTLVADLKQVQASPAGSEKPLAAGQQNLLKGLGMETAKSGTVTLEDFVAKLEGMIREKNPVQAMAGDLDQMAQSFGKSIKSDAKQATANKPVNGSDSVSLQFESVNLKSPQPMSRGKAESEFFSGSNNHTLKANGKEAAKETLPVFEKSLKDTLASTKDSSDTPVFTTKTLTGTDIYGKVSDMKAASPTEKTLPAYVTDQVARQISKAVKMGESEIKFNIRPPEMGRVQLSIENTREGVKINIVTEHHAARDMILSHTTDLKALLSDQGIRLDKIDVDVSGNFGQSMAQARQDAEQSGKERRNKGNTSFDLNGMPENNKEEPAIRSLRHIRGNLDLVA